MGKTSGLATAIPLPKKEEKRLVQAEVNTDLWRAVEEEMQKDGTTIRSVMEYGFKVYLLHKNPAAAKALGIQ